MDFVIVKDSDDDRFRMKPAIQAPTGTKEVTYNCADELDRNLWVGRLIQ